MAMSTPSAAAARPISTFDVGENQKRWLVVGIGLHKVLLPVLRDFVGQELPKHYTFLKSAHGIDTQVFKGPHLTHDGSFKLNYRTINNNWMRKESSYDYKVNTAEDLAKLYLKTYMAEFTGFDYSCDLSAVLDILTNASIFPTNIQTIAKDVRSKVRNEWGHCNFDHWTDNEMGNCFDVMERLLGSLGLPNADEAKVVANLCDLKEKSRSFGAAKSFQSSNAPLATPRRALGDVGNTIIPGTTKARKGLALKPSKPCGKTPRTTKIFQASTGTPATKGLPLLQQISSAGLKQSTKRKHASHVRTTEKQKVKAQQDPCQKEVMFPFTDQEDVLPRPQYVSTISKNVGALYHGCMFQPHSIPDSKPKDDVANDVHFENVTRPAEDSYLESLPFEGELDSLTEGFSTQSLPEIELPPVDIDSL